MSSDTVTPDDIEDHVFNFFGYGNLDAPLWYVGMEEGGDATVESLKHRVAAWRRLGSTPTVDMKRFHELIGGAKWFRERAPCSQRGER